MTITKVSEYLYRGPRPVSHAELAPLGVTAVIDLESGVYEAFHDDYYEEENVKEMSHPCDFGMKSFHLKCSYVFPPSQKAVSEFMEIVGKEHIKYVHCLHGKDRTGYMVAAYRMRAFGWSWQQAVKEMFAMGFHKLPYLWWVLFLRKYAP